MVNWNLQIKKLVNNLIVFWDQYRHFELQGICTLHDIYEMFCCFSFSLSQICSRTLINWNSIKWKISLIDQIFDTNSQLYLINKKFMTLIFLCEELLSMWGKTPVSLPRPIPYEGTWSILHHLHIHPSFVPIRAKQISQSSSVIGWQYWGQVPGQ